MTQPLVSISLQAYNRGHNCYLRTALEAILAQTYSDFELLVIDNHSTDETPEIVLSYKDPRLTYIRLPPGGTPADSIRMAFRASRGTYLLTTHDDDIMEPKMLERQMECVKTHPDLVCLATNVSLINEQGAILQDRLYQMDEDRFYAPGDYIQTYFEEKFWFPTPTLLFLRDAVVSRRHSFLRAKKQRYFPSGDIAGLFRLNTRAPVGILAAPLLRYRQHSEQESRNVDQSGPLVALGKYAEKLLATKKTNSKLLAKLPTARAFLTRYEAQDCLFKFKGKQLERHISTLKARWEKSVTPENRALDVLLPFEVLLGELGAGLTIPLDALDKLGQLPAKGGSQIAYRQWARLTHYRLSLFAGSPHLRRIAILGSMFTAHLLVLSAYRSGIEVLCCLDSSPSRIGNDVFGVPVVPHEQLSRHVSNIDAVILSSERDQEEGLRQILLSHCKDGQFHIYSWKDIADMTTRMHANPLAQ